MTICQRTGPHPCSLGCELRQGGGLNIAPSATPSQMNKIPPARHNPAWERGIVSEKRPDGSRMPLLEPGTLNPLHVKQYAEDKRNIDQQVKRLKTAPAPIT